MTIDMKAMRDELSRDEGRKNKPYRDTVGKLTIGVGRNLDDVGLFDDEIDLLLTNNIQRSLVALSQNMPWFDQVDPVRQRVLVNMVFNMGLLRLMGFHQTLSAVARRDYATAADQMLDSQWAKQVGERAVRLAAMMRTGVAP